MRLPLPFFERRHIGDLMSRVGSIQPIQALLTHGLVDAFIDAILVLTTLVVMILISPVLAAVVVGSTLLYLAISQLLYPALRRRSEEEIVARAKESTYLMETVRGIRAVKLHGTKRPRERLAHRYAR
jgi:ATP-binding cassette subfamily B protein RaxB